VLIDVIHVQERRFFETDIDESRLHPGKNAGHTTLIDVANDSFAFGALNENLLNLAILHQSDASFG
jgi:hypothetical protein